MPKPLREILGAILNDIDAAAVSADVTRSYWRSVYDSNEMLRGSTPSRLRIVEVKVSLPVAFANVEEVRQRDRGLQPVQIANLLPRRVNQPLRDRLAVAIHQRLEATGRNRWLDDDLEEVFRKVVSEEAFELDPKEIDMELLRKYKQDFIANPDEDQTTEFFYSAAELEKVSPDHIVRMDFIIGID